MYVRCIATWGWEGGFWGSAVVSTWLPCISFRLTQNTFRLKTLADQGNVSQADHPASGGTIACLPVMLSMRRFQSHATNCMPVGVSEGLSEPGYLRVSCLYGGIRHQNAAHLGE